MTAPTRPRQSDPTFGMGMSERELEILRLLPGRSNADIGKRLYLETNTVKTHLHRIFVKLGARDRAHAVFIGVAQGLFGGAQPGAAPTPRPMSESHTVTCPALRVPACTCRPTGGAR